MAWISISFFLFKSGTVFCVSMQKTGLSTGKQKFSNKPKINCKKKVKTLQVGSLSSASACTTRIWNHQVKCKFLISNHEKHDIKNYAGRQYAILVVQWPAFLFCIFYCSTIGVVEILGTSLL